MKLILAITGASGSLYVPEFLKLAQAAEVEVHAVISDAGSEVLRLELGLVPGDLDPYVTAWHGFKDFTAPMASGSSQFDAMVILPCTMGTLGAIANGISANLIHRAADVMLKESRPLLLAARETPFNQVHLRNMLKAESLTEMARFFAGRLCDLLGISVGGLKRWGDEGDLAPI
jgi:4-hydroxy-3-polyprenylbenzoate decarboxylase